MGFVLVTACSGGRLSCKICREWDLSVHHVGAGSGRSHHWELVVSSPLCVAPGAKLAPPSEPWQLSCPGALAAARGASPCLRAGFSANGSPLSTLPSVGLGRPAFFFLPPISELLLVGGKSQGCCCPAQGKDGLEGSKKPGEVADVGGQLPLGKAGRQREQIEREERMPLALE